MAGKSKLRDGFKNLALTAGLALSPLNIAPSTPNAPPQDSSKHPTELLNQTPPPAPSLDALRDSLRAGKPINLADIAAGGKCLQLSRSDVLAMQNKATIIWPALAEDCAQAPLLIDAKHGFVAYDGIKVLQFPQKLELYGKAAIESKATSFSVPLSRAAIRKDFLSKRDGRYKLEDFQRYFDQHHIKPDQGDYFEILSGTIPDKKTDPRDFSEQDIAKNIKFAYNIINAVPQFDEPVDYDKRHNLYIYHLMNIEGTMPVLAGANPAARGNVNIHYTKNKNALMSARYEGLTNYAGALQVRIIPETPKDGIASSPFVDKKGWTGFQIGETAITDRQAYVDSWQAQYMDAQFQIQSAIQWIKNTYPKSHRQYSLSGLVAVYHNQGPKGVNEFMNHRGDQSFDGFKTNANDYYKIFKGHDLWIAPKQLFADSGTLDIRKMMPPESDWGMPSPVQVTAPVIQPAPEAPQPVGMSGVSLASLMGSGFASPDFDATPPEKPAHAPNLIRQPLQKREEPESATPNRPAYTEGGAGDPPLESDTITLEALMQLYPPKAEKTEPALDARPAAKAAFNTHLEAITAQPIKAPQRKIEDMAYRPVADDQAVMPYVSPTLKALPSGEALLAGKAAFTRHVDRLKGNPLLRPQTQEPPKAQKPPKTEPRQNETPQPETISMATKATTIGSLIAIPIAAKHFFSGEKNEKTGERQGPSALKILAGLGVIAGIGYLAHRMGAGKWASQILKSRSTNEIYQDLFN